jgi:PAS domain S-box-containing protein
MHIFPNDLQSLFPDDYLIADLSLDAFAGIPIFSSQGNIIGFLVTMHRHSIENSDMTDHALHFFASRVTAELEQKLVFDELKEHESFLQGIINLTEDVLFITDLFGTIKIFSPSAVKILGWLPQELNNQSFYNFLSDDTRQLAIQEFEKCISSGLPKQRIKLMIKNKSGTIHMVEWFATPTTINNEINGCISIFRKLLTEP